LAVLTALGAVSGHDGRVLAGARSPDGSFAEAVRVLLEGDLGAAPPPLAGANSTIAVVATDAALDRAQCRKLAELAQDGFALAIRPAHTMFDGDTVFSVSAGQAKADMVSLGTAAGDAMWLAIERAVTLG